MAIDLPEFSLNLAISKGMNNYFSLIQNCQIKNRKSDIDILQNKLMLTMRPGTQLVGNSISSTGQTSNGVFFTGVDGNRYEYVGHGNKVYKNVAGTWTDIGMTFTNNNFNFTTIKLPYGNPSTVFSSSAVATGSNKLKPDATDTTPALNVGKILMITGNDVPTTSTYAPSSTDVLVGGVDEFRNKYSRITGYDGVNNEYWLETLGNAHFIPNLTKYRLFDRLSNYLQITNGVDDDQYYDGTAANTILKGRVNAHFNRYIVGFKPQTMVNFDGLSFTYNLSILYHSESLNNLWFNANDISEMPFNDIVNEIFVWKNRLIVGGLRNVSYTSRSIIDNKLIYNFTVISDNYGMVKGGVNNFEKDVYFLTNNKQMISLSENQFGIVIPNNVGAVIDNYLQKFNYAICTGFDGRKFYIYGEETSGVTGTICVYDTQYNFWSTYTGLSPSKFILEENTLYILNNKKGEVYKFVDGLFTDNSATITQSLGSIDLDGNNIFLFKECHESLFHFENLTQDFLLDTIKIGSKGQYKFTDKHSIVEQTVIDTGLGENILGESILGGNSIIEGLPLPYILKKDLAGDAALLWMFTITGDTGSPFYLNDMTFRYSLLPDYFNPEFVI